MIFSPLFAAMLFFAAATCHFHAYARAMLFRAAFTMLIFFAFDAAAGMPHMFTRAIFHDTDVIDITIRETYRHDVRCS